MNKILIIADMHLDSTEDPDPSYGLAKLFIKQQKPDTLVILGDALDFSYASSFDSDLFKNRENKRLKKDYDMMNKELDFFQKYAEKVIYFEGNHCYRITTLVQKYPDLEGLVEVPKQLHLKQRKIKWIPEVEQPYKIGNLYLLHGKNYGINYCKKTLQEIGGNCVQAHCHRIQSFSMKQVVDKKEITCWGTGCLTSKSPNYLRGKSNHHMHGCAVCFQEGKIMTFYNIHINGGFIWNGKLYTM